MRIDLAGSMGNAIRALRGEGRAFGMDDIEENRESAAVMLEMVREHIQAVRQGDEGTVKEFRDLYGLNPGDMLWEGEKRRLSSPARADSLEKALLMCAPHCQGGHSAAGHVVAELFEIPFPIQMENLRGAAEVRGYDPAELWPWWSKATPAPTQKAEG